MKIKATFGVPSIDIGEVDPAQTAIGSLASTPVTTSAITPTERDKFTNLKPLSGSYTVLLGLLGMEATSTGNFGYTFGICSAQSTTIPVSLGEGIHFRVPAASFATNMINAVAAIMFLQKGSANPRMAGYAIIDPSGNDFSWVLNNEPDLSAPSFSVAQLQSLPSATDPIRGSGNSVGALFNRKTPSTGGVDFIHRGDQVPYQPDTAPDSEFLISHATDLQFSLLQTDNPTFAQSVGGDYTKYTDTNSNIVEQAELNIYTTGATDPGNLPIRLFMEREADGSQATRLFIGNRTINSAQVTENHQKRQVLRYNFNLQGTAEDTLLSPFATGLVYNRHA